MGLVSEAAARREPAGSAACRAPAGLAASFRDPAGSLVALQGRILRVLNAAGAADLATFLASKASRRLIESGRVVGTELLNAVRTRQLLADPAFARLYEGAHGAAVVEHERIWFPSYPYEWPPEMLHASGQLTLGLARELLADGFGLKDGTPYNVLFRGPEPVFIDVLSFERRDRDDPVWLPYAQFVRTFLLPLAASGRFGLSMEQLLAARRDGLEPEEVYRWLGPLERLRPPFLGLVSMPTWLARGHDAGDASIYRRRRSGNPEKARFILRSLLGRLERALARVEPSAGRASAWSSYMASNNNYSAGQFAAKEAFVRQALERFRPRRVLDAGANTGHFSALAARAGASVVAIDYDPVALGQLWRSARAERLDILPLAVDLTRPSPGTGWRNRECSSFLDRARGAFDAVLMLALIHHMLVSERIPLAEILDLAAELTTGIAVIEFIGPEDSMFRRLVRGREELHASLTPEGFETACRRRFEILLSERHEGAQRWLYLLRKTK